MTRLDFDLDDDTHARAKAAAALQRISLREFVRQAIAEKLERDAGAGGHSSKRST